MSDIVNFRMEHEEHKHRNHRSSRAGRGHDKKKNKPKFSFADSSDAQEPKLDPSREAAKKRNPKAFAVQAPNAMRKVFHRSQDQKSKKQHIPVVDKTPEEPPPIIVAIVGPPKVGKTTLLRSLIKVS